MRALLEELARAPEPRPAPSPRSRTRCGCASGAWIASVLGGVARLRQPAVSAAAVPVPLPRRRGSAPRGARRLSMDAGQARAAADAAACDHRDSASHRRARRPPSCSPAADPGCPTAAACGCVVPRVAAHRACRFARAHAARCGSATGRSAPSIRPAPRPARSVRVATRAASNDAMPLAVELHQVGLARAPAVSASGRRAAAWRSGRPPAGIRVRLDERSWRPLMADARGARRDRGGHLGRDRRRVAARRAHAVASRPRPPGWRSAYMPVRRGRGAPAARVASCRRRAVRTEPRPAAVPAGARPEITAARRRATPSGEAAIVALTTSAGRRS